jgi:hypothetical protein
MENINPIDALILVGVIEELKKKVGDLETLQEILVAQYNQTVINYNTRFARLEEQIIKMQNSFLGDHKN